MATASWESRPTPQTPWPCCGPCADAASGPYRHGRARSRHGHLLKDVCITEVPMRNYGDAEIDAYVRSPAIHSTRRAPTPYSIDGSDRWRTCSGCHASVMGLPLCHLLRLLDRLTAPDPNRLPARCQTHLDYLALSRTPSCAASRSDKKEIYEVRSLVRLLLLTLLLGACSRSAGGPTPAPGTTPMMTGTLPWLASPTPPEAQAAMGQFLAALKKNDFVGMYAMTSAGHAGVAVAGRLHSGNITMRSTPWAPRSWTTR